MKADLQSGCQLLFDCLFEKFWLFDKDSLKFDDVKGFKFSNEVCNSTVANGARI